jgi:hypothetical protein
MNTLIVFSLITESRLNTSFNDVVTIEMPLNVKGDEEK